MLQCVVFKTLEHAEHGGRCHKTRCQVLIIFRSDDVVKGPVDVHDVILHRRYENPYRSFVLQVDHQIAYPVRDHHFCVLPEGVMSLFNLLGRSPIL